MEPGVYFGLSEEEYHADKSFSSSGCKDILVSPLTYWINSAHNPDREDKASDPQDRGKAFHTRLLEGKDAFFGRYAIKPDPADYPAAIMDGKGLRERCGELGEKKSGTNLELCERILEVDPDAVLWPQILADFEDESEGKIVLPYKLVLEIERQSKIVELQDAARKAFGGGFPEVSIFWIDAETGTPMKARLDYLKTRAVVDLKTFTNQMSMQIDVAIARAVANYKYHIQAFVYLDGIETVKELYRGQGSDCIHGDAPKDWLDAWANPKPHAFAFVFLEAGDVPNVRVREFRQTETYAQMGASTNLYWQSAWAGYRNAIALHKQCMETYGPDTPWVDAQPMRAFSDDDFPQFMFG